MCAEKVRLRPGQVSSSPKDANVWHARAKEHENARAHVDSQNTTPTQARTQAKPLRDLQNRVYELETHVRAAGSQPSSSERYLGLGHPAGPRATSDKNALPDSERALLRGKSFKTQYFGPSHGASILLQFEELSRFVKDILHRLPTLEKHRDIWKHQRKELNPTLMLPEFDTLVAMLPEQARADALVRDYFETLETTYRVLHAPMFFRKYKELWGASLSKDSSVFLVQLLLVCASVNCAVAGGPSGFRGRSSVGRDMAVKWIEVCENWLDLQSQKHVTLEVFQVRALLVIAKKLNCVKIKREWTVSGQLLRAAMSSGLHREPTFLSKNISVFDQEMRRRLWFTILELDLQNSLDRGMGTSIGPFDWDTLPPLNLHDEDFDEDTETMPFARPITEFTRTSFLCLAQQHLPLRLEIISTINSIRVSLEKDAAIELDQRIRQILDTIPEWNESAAKAISKDLSELLLYESLLLIHQPFATEPGAQAKHFYSRAARRSAALATMKIFTHLRSSSGMIMCNLRDGLFRACLATCHDIVVSVNSKEGLMQDRSTAVRLVEDSVNLMEDRIRGLGQGFHSYWLAASALGLLRSEPADKCAQETADRVAKLFEYMVLQQIAPLEGVTGVEDATMSTANTLVGMSGQPTQALPELDPFVTTTTDPFSALSETLFDFDITDLWSMGGMGGGTHY
ncbi:hypothetical protein A1O7_05680 [Cladophialophora yegresii CBS 114405]|uniref:Xylanolytic transcriptional activator regulatory domain-containing protein n=1 Tax=Cladophialophora yegresii CBS 114405 TaxID=1182544 RepID=W9VZU8_9EURO|nr:uncharacterized protein A1O7_05680 [Cladophialophora yegresii CBS 114405]EXJ58255.1 hypothetical protein A1O7_05680 [Cladophialophora yegresii CBS 114405]